MMFIYLYVFMSCEFFIAIMNYQIINHGNRGE